MLDCAITNGVVIDGTGRPGMHADVGVRDGRVVAVGQLEEGPDRVIDAEGRVVAPGFIDVHTHYDAQVMWDMSVSPSSLHGVTTVIGGNCGFTLAPVNEDSADYVLHMLACVEGMPSRALEAALDFRWGTFGEWLARLEGRLAVNAGFLVGHSTIRKLVMGDGWRAPSTPDQVEQMARMVDESVREGALGFSSSWGSAHRDHVGDPVPSRFATGDELITLASVLRAHPGTMLEFIPPGAPSWSDDVIDTMTAMSVESQRPLNWNLLSVGTSLHRAQLQARLAVSDRAADRGGRIVALTIPRPQQLRVNLKTTIAYNTVSVWPQILALPMEEKIRALRDAETRGRMATAAAESHRAAASAFLEFDRMTIESVGSSAIKPLVGRTVGDIARERECSAFDTFLDIVADDELLTCFQTPAMGDDEQSWKERAEYWRDPRVLVGGSDAGAHLDALSTFAFYTDFVGPTVRERGLLTLEDAVQKVTEAPAHLYGLVDRGRLAPGYLADVVVFDPETVATGPIVLRNDLPNDEYRLFADAVGVDHVLVRGIDVVDHGRPTGSTPGQIIRP
jgi:N-acyl-D-aspartate/D-glutamate deacylase